MVPFFNIQNDTKVTWMLIVQHVALVLSEFCAICNYSVTSVFKLWAEIPSVS